MLGKYYLNQLVSESAWHVLLPYSSLLKIHNIYWSKLDTKCDSMACTKQQKVFTLCQTKWSWLSKIIKNLPQFWIASRKIEKCGWYYATVWISKTIEWGEPMFVQKPSLFLLFKTAAKLLCFLTINFTWAVTVWILSIVWYMSEKLFSTSFLSFWPWKEKSKPRPFKSQALNRRNSFSLLCCCRRLHHYTIVFG